MQLQDCKGLAGDNTENKLYQNNQIYIEYWLASSWFLKSKCDLNRQVNILALTQNKQLPNNFLEISQFPQFGLLSQPTSPIWQRHYRKCAMKTKTFPSGTTRSNKQG